MEQAPFMPLDLDDNDGDNDVISTSNGDDKIGVVRKCLNYRHSYAPITYHTIKAYPNPIKDWLHLATNQQ